MSFSRYFQVILLVIVLSQCSSNPLDIDVSDVDTNYASRRFDTPLFDTDRADSPDYYQDLYQNYGPFFAAFVEDIVQLGPISDPNTAEALHRFTNDATVLELQTAIDNTHADRFEAYDNQLENAFRHYAYYFGDSTPEVIYYNSGLNFAVYPGRTHLGIGLDFYLGPDHEIVQNLPPDVFPQYFRDKMDPGYLVADAMKGWLLVRHQDKMDQSDLLSQIMYYGKIMYLMDACMPETPDHVKMTYSELEQAWAEANESGVWRQLADEKVLYEIRTFEINKWVQDGPFTNAGEIPQESPARLGIWIAWQIVRDYMEKNPEVTLPALLEETDYQEIMRFYRPG
jgi:hypothetical protein